MVSYACDVYNSAIHKTLPDSLLDTCKAAVSPVLRALFEAAGASRRAATCITVPGTIASARHSIIHRSQNADCLSALQACAALSTNIPSCANLALLCI
jgi:hypothetical protein